MMIRGTIQTSTACAQIREIRDCCENLQPWPLHKPRHSHGEILCRCV